MLLRRWLNPRSMFLIPVVLTLLVGVACAGAADPTVQPTTAPTAATASGETAAPTTALAAPTFTPIPAVQPTVRPAAAVGSRDDVIIVLAEEPTIPNIFLATTAVGNFIGHNITLPFSFYGPDFVDTPTGGFEGFEQLAPNKWRLHLTQGVKFHNGELWNAAAAKFSIDFLGDPENGSQTFANVRGSHAEVVDEFTVDFVCDEVACPVLPRFSQFTVFQAPEWYQNTSEEARNEKGEIIGWGPYKWKEWKRGVFYKLERYEDYVDPGDRFIAQRGSIKEVTYIWRGEELVRAAMIQTGEADVAYALGASQIEALESSPKSKWVRANNGEVLGINNDQIWDPFLKQLKFRQALAHALDCETMVFNFYGAEAKCRSGPNGIPGVLGVNEENTKPIYTYDPAKAQQLLEETGYFDTGDKLEDRHELGLWLRNGRYPNDVEIAESVISFWNEAGVNAKMHVVERSIFIDHHLTGPGRIVEAGGTIEDVATSSPPPPLNASPGMYFLAPGGELFDFARQLNFYASCQSNRSKNCDLEREERNNAAVGAAGEERQRLMTAAYEDFTRNLLHIPLFDVLGVWGVNADLDFVDMPGGRRILVNTMTWTK